MFRSISRVGLFRQTDLYGQATRKPRAFSHSLSVSPDLTHSESSEIDHRLFVGQLLILNIIDLLPSNGYEEIFLSLAVLGSVVDTFYPYMEEDAIITAVHPATTRSLGKDLEIDSLHVSFRLVRRLMYDDQINKATFKRPAWLSDLQPSAPSDGYLMENGQFTVELANDERIKQDLRVTIEVTGI
jgi:hypothetical protein